MCERQFPNKDAGKVSSSINRAYMDALIKSRPRQKTRTFFQLEKEVNDAFLSEVLWIFYGEGSISALDAPIKHLNMERKWWDFFRPKNTIRSLLRSQEGKERVWQMLHDAGAWL